MKALTVGMRFKRRDGLCGYEIEEIRSGNRLDVRYRTVNLTTGQKQGRQMSCGSAGWLKDVADGNLIPVALG